MAQAPVLSVVDYAAWEKGYMPPSEHVLIDQLAYRGARVVLGSDWGDMAVWVVMRGKKPTPAIRKALREMLDLFLNEDDEHLGTGSESATGLGQIPSPAPELSDGPKPDAALGE